MRGEGRHASPVVSPRRDARRSRFRLPLPHLFLSAHATHSVVIAFTPVMSSRLPPPPPKANTLHLALTRVGAIGVLLGLSLATWSYCRALEPQYGSAATALHMSKIVWSAAILGSFAPTVPLSSATLALSLLLYVLPTVTYYAAVYTARLGDPVWGPVATHLMVLLPVLSLGVALVKALQVSSW